MRQLQALEILKSGKNVFLTGEPGSGKTHTINRFTAWLREHNKNFAITASTGIAATHVDGVTIHSWSGIRLKRKITVNNLGDFESDRFLVARIQQPKVLIVDEVSMLDATFIEMMDKILRHFRESDKPFGGIQIVFVGDFFQLPPVVKKGKNRLAFESDSWAKANLTVCYLTEQHRQSEPEFLDILSAMRKGAVTADHRGKLAAAKMEKKPKTKLFTHNDDVDWLNEQELGRLPGPLHEFKMITTGVHPSQIEILKKHLLSPELLLLKKDAIVMFTRNNFGDGFANGTIGTVDGFNSEGHPVIRLKNGNLVTPKRETWRLEENGREKASAKQFPLKLAWAITVHKSQGMSLDEATIDLSKCFEYGQGYVALSRVRSLSGMHLEAMSENAFLMSPKVMKHDRELRRLSDIHTKMVSED
jgi:ATP-dependent DNA helicase PIF1